MGFDYRKLRGRITEKYGNISNFSKAYDISKNALSQKLNNKMRFTSDDIVKICKMLEIPKEEIGLYFFTPKV